MEYSEKIGKMECPFCGNQQEVPTADDMIVENDFREAISLTGQEEGLDKEMKEIGCDNCGAKTMVEPDKVTVECPFCGSKNINEGAHDTKSIKPQGLIPFSIDEKKAVKIFEEWIGKGFWQPSSLKKKVSGVDTIDGVYVPFWTYDAKTASNWTADAGYYYYVTETYTDSDGNTKTRQVRKVRWVPASGYYSNFFDDVTVIASKGITQKRVEKIYPFDSEKRVNYDPKYLLGKEAEVYALDVEQGFEVADKIMDDYIKKEIIKRIPGDTYRDLRVRTRKDNITFKHLLYPIWIAAYIYNDKSYQVVINGDSGKISGKKPVSTIKIIIAVLLAIAIAVGIYFLVKN